MLFPLARNALGCLERCVCPGLTLAAQNFLRKQLALYRERVEITPGSTRVAHWKGPSLCSGGALPSALHRQTCLSLEDGEDSWRYTGFPDAIQDSQHPEHDAVPEWIGGASLI